MSLGKHRIRSRSPIARDVLMNRNAGVSDAVKNDAISPLKNNTKGEGR